MLLGPSGNIAKLNGSTVLLAVAMLIFSVFNENELKRKCTFLEVL
jgi:hypothetical protein